MKLDLLKEHYFFELNRKQSLESALALPIAIFTGIGGVIFSLSQTFDYKYNSITYIFLAFLGITVISLSFVFYYICRASIRYTYELVPSSLELLNYWKSLESYYRTNETLANLSTEEFDNNLKDGYATASTTNKTNNDKRASYLFRCNSSLIVSVLFLGFCAVPYSIGLNLKETKPQKIEIENLKDLKGNDVMPNNTNSTQDNSLSDSQENDSQQNQQSSPPPSPDAPAKPDFPRNTISYVENERLIITTDEYLITEVKPAFPSNDFVKEGDLSDFSDKG